MFLFFVFKRITNLHYYHEYQRTQRDNTHTCLLVGVSLNQMQNGHTVSF